MSDLLDWAEKAGVENLKARRENAEHLLKEGVTTFTILIAAATGALAYVIKGLEAKTWWLVGGAGTFSTYMYVLCAVLVLRVLQAKDLPALYNEPMSLYQKQYSLEALREVELKNLQERIDKTTARNDATAKSLNRIRLWAVASPLAFLIGVTLAAVLPCVLVAVAG
jgi:hypothetical protein